MGAAPPISRDAAARAYSARLQELCAAEADATNPPLLWLERRLFVDNNLLFKRYARIVGKACLLLGSPFQVALNRYAADAPLSFWTDHGPGHAFSVLTIVNRLCASLQCVGDLTASECFVLLCACWSHDIGMFIHRPGLTTADQRKYHGRISGDALFAAEFGSGSQESGADLGCPVSMVCAAHQEGVELQALTPLNVSGQTIRIPVLGALLRLADALDISYDRAEPEFFKYFEALYGRPGDASVFEWNVNWCTEALSVGRREVGFRVAPAEQFERFREMQTNYKKNALQRHGLRFHQCLLNESLRSFKAKVGKYIANYIAEHVATIDGQGEGAEVLWDELRAWTLLITEADGVEKPLAFESLSAQRRDQRRALRDAREFWVASCNHDPEVAALLSEVRGVLPQPGPNDCVDVFLFLCDREKHMLRLWCGNGFYNPYAAKANYSDEEFDSELRRVVIPLKCGIAGYVAWMGEGEVVRSEDHEVRASFEWVDRALSFSHLVLAPLIDSGRLVGTVLVNFSADAALGEFLRSHRIGGRPPAAEDILGAVRQEKLLRALRRHAA